MPEGLSQQNILYIPSIVLQHAMTTSPDVKTELLRSVISMDQQSIVMYLSLKGLNLGTSKTGLQVHHLRGSITFCRRLVRFFSSLKKPHWNAGFWSGWTDWRNVVWQLVV
jgi:hypothetical protein